MFSLRGFGLKSSDTVRFDSVLFNSGVWNDRLLRGALFTGFELSGFVSDFADVAITVAFLEESLASSSSRVWKEALLRGAFLAGGVLSCAGVRSGSVSGLTEVTRDLGFLRSSNWRALLTSSHVWGASASNVLSFSRIGAGTCEGFSWCSSGAWFTTSHGSSMALMSKTAKLAGAGRYARSTVALTRVEEAHPILCRWIGVVGFGVVDSR